jgi:large-conductance mechanosensitive channel
MKLYKVLYWLFISVVPLSVGWLAFYDGQDTQVVWSFSGIFILLIIFISLYNKHKTWYKEQKQAHETARNLGQLSHTVNFWLMGVSAFIFTAIPFIVLGLLDGVLTAYEGNITLWIGYLLISFAVGHFFNTLNYYSEQKKIYDKQVKQQQAHNEALANEIKERL